jgi:hypothetical protein
MVEEATQRDEDTALTFDRLRALASVAQDGRHDEVLAAALRSIGQRLVGGEPVPDDVLAQDVVDLDRLGGGWNVLGVELGQHDVLLGDVVELAFENAQLLIGQTQPGEVGDVLDVLP